MEFKQLNPGDFYKIVDELGSSKFMKKYNPNKYNSICMSSESDEFQMGVDYKIMEDRHVIKTNK